MSALNRILQTELRQQISRTGNVSETMFDFIDDNKYMVTDNRYPFITAQSPYTTFRIEHSGLEYRSWVSEVYRRLGVNCHVHTPYTIIENTNLRKRPAHTLHDDEGFHQPSMSSSPPPSLQNDSTVALMGFEEIKKRRLDESVGMLDRLQKTKMLNRRERLEALKAIKANNLMEVVEELTKKFDDEQGHALIRRLSDEQRQCFESIIRYAFPQDFTTAADDGGGKCNEDDKPKLKIPKLQPLYKLYLIEGSAGCGKSSIIESLNFYCYSRHKRYTKLLYITQTNVLCQSMRNKCLYNDGMEYLTFFKFLGIMGLDYYNKKQLLMNCDALRIDAFQHTCGTNFLRDINTLIPLPPMDGDPNDREQPRLFIIFDEIYTVSDGKLSLFLFIVRCLKIKYPNLNIYCILIGDKNQLLPFTKTENVKLHVQHLPSTEINPTEGEDSVTETTMVDEENDDIMCSLIAQNESLLNAEHYVLQKQHRICDEVYNEFVNRVRHSDNTVETGRALLEEIYRLWPQKINSTLTLLYPVDEILHLWQSTPIDDYRNIVLRENGIFRRTIDTIVFCFTNRHAHYYNIALSFSYLNQIRQHLTSTTTTHKQNKFIIFSIIFNAEYLKLIGDNYTIRQLINNRNYLVNILPLIRYCPYKILTSGSPVARLSIVYLLDWQMSGEGTEDGDGGDGGGQILSVVVFSPDTNVIFTLLPCKFEMNLFKRTTLFGFPLQIAFSSTFASSQGLTLNNKIAISCSNISKSELYVCLTRIKTSNDLVSIY